MEKLFYLLFRTTDESSVQEGESHYYQLENFFRPNGHILTFGIRKTF